MKRLFAFIAFIALNTVYCLPSNAQGKLDTLYYNKNWNETINTHFAEYTLVTYEPEDTTLPKEYRCFYRNGNLHSEGAYISIDRRDARNSRFDINRTVYDNNGEICEYYEYKNGELNGSVVVKNEDGSTSFLEYANGSLAKDYALIEYPNGVVLKYDLINNVFLKDCPIKENIYSVMYNGNEWQYYNMNGIIVGVCVSKVKDYGKYFQVSVIVANYTPHRFNFGVNNINCVIKAYDKKGILQNSEYANVLDKEQYLKDVKNRQIWNEIGAGILLGLSSAASDLSGTYNRTITTTVSSPYTTYSQTNITTTYYDNTSRMYQGYMNAQMLVNQSIQHSYDLDRLSVGYLSENTIFPNTELSGHIMIPENLYYSGFSKPNWQMEILIEIDGVIYPFCISLGEFWGNREYGLLG
jgi:hypothetical protein